jgi:hypothetical protein
MSTLPQPQPSLYERLGGIYSIAVVAARRRFLAGRLDAWFSIRLSLHNITLEVWQVNY